MLLVSVLMTVYNREQYIAEAIESVLASTFTNFELIIVDDCSTDQSYAIAKNFADMDKRIRLYKNEQNLGDYSNRNKAASYAKGKYIKYVDSDDIIYPHGLEVMVNAMENYPEAGIGFEDFCFKGNNPLPKLYSPTEIYKRHFFDGGILFVGPLGSIYRKDYFEELGGFDPEFKVAADYEFNLKAAQNKPVITFQRDLFYYRRHNGQEINIHQEKYLSLNYLINKKYLTDSSCPLSFEQRQTAYKNLLSSSSRKIFSEIIHLRFIRAYKLFCFFKLPAKAYLFSILPEFLRKKFN